MSTFITTINFYWTVAAALCCRPRVKYHIKEADMQQRDPQTWIKHAQLNKPSRSSCNWNESSVCEAVQPCMKPTRAISPRPSWTEWKNECMAQLSARSTNDAGLSQECWTGRC